MAERIQYLSIKIDNNDTILLDSTTRSYDISNLTAGSHTATITAICKEHGTATTKSITFTVAGSSTGGGDTPAGSSYTLTEMSFKTYTYSRAVSSSNPGYVCFSVDSAETWPFNSQQTLTKETDTCTINGTTMYIYKFTPLGWQGTQTEAELSNWGTNLNNAKGVFNANGDIVIFDSIAACKAVS